MAMDDTFGEPLSLSLSEKEVGEDWPLIRYLIDDDEYRSRYVAYIEETIQNVFYPDRMKEIYNTLHELIRPYVLNDDGEIIEGYTLLTDGASFDSSFEYLSNHVESRYDEATQFILNN